MKTRFRGFWVKVTRFSQTTSHRKEWRTKGYDGRQKLTATQF